MSIVGTTRVTCPGCNTPQDCKLVQSINTRQAPADKQRLLAGELNVMACTCGKRVQLAATILFHDPDAEFLCQVCLGDAAEMAKATALIRAAGATGTRRLVPSQNALIEKVKIIDAKLEDWAIEMTKVLLLASIEPHSHSGVLPTGGKPRSSIEPHSHSGVLPTGGKPRSSIEPHSHSGVLPTGGKPRSSIEPHSHSGVLPTGGKPRSSIEPHSHSGVLPTGGKPRSSIGAPDLDRVLLFELVDREAQVIRWLLFDEDGRAPELVSSPLAAYDRLVGRPQGRPADDELRVDRAWAVEAVRAMIADAN